MATRYIAKCKACGIHTSALHAASHIPTVPADGSVYYHPQTGDIVLNCRGCHRAKYAKMVRGKFSATHECNAKCMASHGTACECSCGGKNHGGAHAA
jgi:hypothetical protein